MNRKSKHARLLELGKDVLIVLLACSAVWLTCLWPRHLRSATLSVKSSRASVCPLSELRALLLCSPC